jgi:hypothetical protein
MIFLHVILLLNLSVLVYVLNQLDEVTTILRVLARLYHPQTFLQFLLQSLVDVVTALTVLHKRQLYET